MFTQRLTANSGACRLWAVSFTPKSASDESRSWLVRRFFHEAKTQTPHWLKASAAFAQRPEGSGAVALLEFLAAAARARIVAANVFQLVAHWLLRRMAAMRAMYMTVIVVMGVAMIMIVVAVGAMNVGLLGHCLITLE